MEKSTIAPEAIFKGLFDGSEDILRLLWKRKLWLIVPLLLGGGFALGLIKVLPPTYQASTMILVESQKIPTEYIRPTVTTAVSERLRTIEQQIKNRENLERIVLEMDLYPERRQTRGMDFALQLVSKNLRLGVMGDQIFEIYFSGRDPAKVAATANRVADLFIEENLRRRATEAENTSAFLAEELEETKGLLEEQERKVGDYRILHAGRLPDDRGANMQAIDQLETQLEIAQEQIRETELQIMVFRREVPPSLEMAESEAAEKPRSRLVVAREELRRLTAQYTDLHPDVIRLRREVELLEVQEVSEQPLPSTGTPTSAREVGLEAEMKIAALEAALARQKEKRDRTLSDLAVYRRRLDAIPRVEQDLVQLTRDYENLQGSYQSLLSKRIEARLAENLERKRKSEQFTVLEHAVVPTKPYAPNKLQIMLLGLGGGAALGFGLTLVRERTDQTYRDPASLKAAFPNVRFLGAVHRVDRSDLDEGSNQAAERTA